MPKGIDIYLLEKKIGRGQFGDVYKGLNKKDGTEVAIKCINRNLIKGKFNELLENEIQVLRSCNNNNIIRLIDIKKTTNNIYLVMEFCNEGDLGALLKAKKKFTEQEALEYFVQIIHGFQTLVKNKIMHRDFKLPNVLKHDGIIKIADFGFAKLLETEDQFLETVLGSPLNMAPEILDRKNYNSKADIWSIGVTFYEMLTGNPPFKGANIVELLRNINTTEPNIPEWIPPIINDVLKKMLVREPTKRIEWSDLFNHPVLTMLDEEIENGLTQSMVANQNHISLEMSKFYIKTNMIIQNTAEIEAKQELNQYIQDVAANRTQEKYKGKLIKRQTERSNEHVLEPSLPVNQEENLEGEDLCEEKEYETRQSSQSLMKISNKIVLHHRNLYAFLGLLSEELVEIHLNTYAECLAFLNLKRALLKLNQLKKGLENNTLEGVNWPEYSLTNNFKTLYNFIKSEEEIFNRFYEKLSFKVLETEALMRFEEDLMLSGRYSPEETQQRIYEKVLKEYFIRVLDKYKFNVNNKLALHLWKLLESIDIDLFADLSFDFNQYYARHAELELSKVAVFEVYVEKDFKKFIKNT